MKENKGGWRSSISEILHGRQGKPDKAMMTIPRAANEMLVPGDHGVEHRYNPQEPQSPHIEEKE